jgi:two-component system nitrogen regulation sensor histidine kinase GlnL
MSPKGKKKMSGFIPVHQKEKSKALDKKTLESANFRCEFSVDSAFVVKTWDSNMEKLCHKPAQSVIGNKINKVFPMLCEKVALIFAEGEKRRIKNFQNICFLGTDLTADIQLIPIKDRNGKVKEVSIVLSDISGGCPLDKKMSDSERMVAIGKVASTLAHGIRNPLNAIKGAVVYLTEKYGGEPSLVEFSKIINDEINRLDNFISDFLSASKGKTKFLPMNLNNILKEILVMVRPRTELQNIIVSSDFLPLPPIVADPFQAEQAFFNLLNNAIEAMPDGGAIDVRTSLSHEDGIGYAVVEISDTGRGIPRQALSRLGELSASPKKDNKGFGIFLSREIIKSHGGKLFWESIKDKGTTFKILLPLQEQKT